MRKWLIKSFTNLFPNSPKLQITTDIYKGVHIKLEYDEFPDYYLFNTITNLVTNKQQKDISSIWVHLQPKTLWLMSTLCIDYNFKIHHNDGNNVSLYQWLREDMEDMVVPSATSHLACGSIVINQGRILLIEEKGGKRAGQYGIPGGRALLNEDLRQCAERELFEYTGVKATFKKMVYIRQLSPYTYGFSDVYFACLMKLTGDIGEIKICNKYISSYYWVPLKDLKYFMVTRSVGTQLHLSNYLIELYYQGYNFEAESVDNYTKFEYYLKAEQHMSTYIGHKLINCKKNP